jgi:hypothetical protein
MARPKSQAPRPPPPPPISSQKGTTVLQQSSDEEIRKEVTLVDITSDQYSTGYFISNYIFKPFSQKVFSSLSFFLTISKWGNNNLCVSFNANN